MRVFAPAAATLMALASIGAAAYDSLPNGTKLYGLNYDRRQAPDWNPKQCKDYQTVLEDLRAVQAVADRVRVYSLGSDSCDSVDVLNAAKSIGLKVALGMWPGKKDKDSDRLWEAEKARLVRLLDAGKIDDTVVALHVGSEAVYRKDYSAEVAVDYLNQVKQLLKQYNVNLKLTIADVVDSYYQNPIMLQNVDYVSINQFSFWERVDVADGMSLMLDRIRSIRSQAAAQGKDVIISETGWASGGSDARASAATPENQKYFFEAFYRQMKAHNIPYYWFAAQDNLWSLEDKEKSTVEAYFGMMSMERVFKANFRNVALSDAKVTTFKSMSGRYLGESYNPDAPHEVTGVATWEPSNDKLVQLRYQWFYDEATGHIRSTNSDRCLDAYQAWDGGIVHTYKCIENEPNQKWKYDAATKTLRHAAHVGFCLDNDPAQNYKLSLYGCSESNKNQMWEINGASSGGDSGSDADVGTDSKTVRLFAKQGTNFPQAVRAGDDVVFGFGASGVAGSEWTFNPSTHLVQLANSNLCLDAYEGKDGGDVHMWTCNANEPNQMWDLDSSTGQFRHRTHAGFCLDGDLNGNKIQLWWCMNSDNQMWRVVSSSAKAVRITNADSSVVEFVTQDQQLGKNAENKNQQAWFWNAFKGTLVSKWNGECLDAYEPWQNGRVHTWGCVDSEKNQKWKYENGLVKHASHTGYCLAYANAANRQLVLKSCSSSDATQKFTLAAF